MGCAMVFIDGSNLYHSLKNDTSSTQLHFGKFGAKLAAPDQLHTVYYYNTPRVESSDPAKYKDQQRFFARVGDTDGVIIRFGRMKLRNGVQVEKGVDVLLAVDMLKHAFQNDYDTAILVSGDGDFAELVSAVTNRGKIVKNAAFRSARSEALVKVSHTFIALTDAYLADCRP